MAEWTPEAACRYQPGQLDARDLPVPDSRGRPVRLEFRDLAQCLDEGGGAEPVVVFSLAAVPRPAEFDVTLYSVDDVVLAASMELVDSGFQPLRRFAFEDFVSRSGRFTRRVFLNAGDDDSAVYLVIRPDLDWYGSEHTRVSGTRMATVWMAGGFMGSYADGRESRRTVSFLDMGELSIEDVTPAAGTGEGL